MNLHSPVIPKVDCTLIIPLARCSESKKLHVGPIGLQQTWGVLQYDFPKI